MTVAPMILEDIHVVPDQPYFVNIEVMHTDTDGKDEYADIAMDDQTFNKCNPSGPDFECTWHTCSLENQETNPLGRTITSTDGVIKFNATYSRGVTGNKHCNVNGLAGTAFVRVTLTPEKGKGT